MLLICYSWCSVAFLACKISVTVLCYMWEGIPTSYMLFTVDIAILSLVSFSWRKRVLLPLCISLCILFYVLYGVLPIFRNIFALAADITVRCLLSAFCTWHFDLPRSFWIASSAVMSCTHKDSLPIVLCLISNLELVWHPRHARLFTNVKPGTVAPVCILQITLYWLQPFIYTINLSAIHQIMHWLEVVLIILA